MAGQMVSTSRFLGTLALCAGVAGTVPPCVRAATITVDDTADELNADGSCSLREAIQAANTDTAVDGCAAGNGADVINLPAGTYTLSIPRSGNQDDNLTGDLDLVSDIELVGAGREVTIIDGGAIDRVIDARCAPNPDPDADDECGVTTIRIAGVTLRNGNPPFGRGGGLRVAGDAGQNATSPVTLLEHSRVTANVAQLGGGVGDEGVLTVRNSLIDNNSCSSWACTGGGLDTFGVTLIEDSEIAENVAMRAGGVHNNAKMTVRRTLIRDNVASDESAGGFMDVNGHSVLENVTITGNSANTTGGGIACGHLGDSCNIEMSHCTVAFNTAGAGAGVAKVNGTLRVTNSIIAGNGSLDVAGAFVSQGNNLIENVGSATGFGAQDLLGIDPMLQALADNGGSMFSLALGDGSPAVDAGSCIDNDSTTVTLDQRGLSRPFGASCDIGSFEQWPPAKALVQAVREEPGDNCAAGGTRIVQGLDLNGDGELTGDDEVTDVQYVCNGQDGDDGANGEDGQSSASTLIASSALSVGDSHCPHGGVQLDLGLDDGDASGTARDAILQAGEIDATHYVCNGPDGLPGAAGANGEDGANGANGEDGASGANGERAVARVSELGPDGGECVNGGVLLEAGFDADADGQLQDSEVSTSASVCAPKNAKASSCSVTQPGASPGGRGLLGMLSLLLGAFVVRRRSALTGGTAKVRARSSRAGT